MRTQQQRATHRQKRNYDSKAVARAFPIGSWVLRYYPPARKDKLCSPWIGPWNGWWEYRWTLTHAYSTFTWTISNAARLQIPRPVGQTWRAAHLLCSVRAHHLHSRLTQADQSPTESGGVQRTGSVTSNEDDARASVITDQSEDIPTDTNTPPKTVWDLQDANCILSKNSECWIDFRGFAFTQWKHYFMPCNFSL